MALLDDERGGFFEEEEEEEGEADLCSVEDVQPFVDLEADFREALRDVVLQIATKPSTIDVLISMFKRAHYAMADEEGVSEEAKLSFILPDKIKQMTTRNSASWAKFFSLSRFLPKKSGTDVTEMLLPSKKTAYFAPTWTLLQAMEELSDEQLQQLLRIEDRLAGPLIFVIRKSLLNQCVEKSEEKAFRLFAKNDRNDKDNNDNKGANILDVLGVRLVRLEEDGGGSGGEKRVANEGSEIVRFDPPKSWKEKLELASALKIIYAIFGGERRVKNFLGTESKSPFLCCIG